MSQARKHRRSVANYRAREAMQQADEAPAVWEGTRGPYALVRRGPVMFFLARPLPGMAPELREALSLRLAATLGGACVCGGRRHVRVVRVGHVGRQAFVHENDCPASDVAVMEIARRTGWKLAT